MSVDEARVRLLFSDGGAYHTELVALPRARLAGYDRLIDCLREDPDVLMRLHVDVSKLCAAYVVGEEGSDEGSSG